MPAFYSVRCGNEGEQDQFFMEEYDRKMWRLTDDRKGLNKDKDCINK